MSRTTQEWGQVLEMATVRAFDRGAAEREKRIIAWLRKPSEDGVDCSADREMLAQRLERREHLR